MAREAATPPSDSGSSARWASCRATATTSSTLSGPAPTVTVVWVWSMLRSSLPAPLVASAVGCSVSGIPDKATTGHGRRVDAMSKVPAAEQTLRILGYLGAQRGPVPAAAIATALGLPRPTAYHLLPAPAGHRLR